jgi:hypothetical protein
MASLNKMSSRFTAPMVSGHTSLQVDALELIEADHARIAMLFAEFDRQASQGNVEAKLGIAAQIFLELKVHMQVVEEIFHPAACTALEDSGAVRWVLDRHAVVRRLISQLESTSNADEDYDTKVMILGEYAMRDVEVEETALFPQVKAAGMDLEQVGAALNFRRSELMSVLRA